MRYEVLCALATLSGIVPCLAVPAAAQEQTSNPTPSTDSATSKETENPDTIVVTARRKEEALTTVPASITAYGSDFLRKQNITSFADYATKVPNLAFQYGQGAGTPLWNGGRQTTIRGVVGADTTAYYIDDTPVPSSVSPQPLNLDRIEILKGPQGTLFGASSMGGNLRFITKTPSLNDNSGIVQLSGGHTAHGKLDVDANGQTSLVLSPSKVALQIAAGYTRDSGYITRRFADGHGTLVSRDGQGRNETISGSAKLRAALTDELDVTVSAVGQISKLHGFPAAYARLREYRPISLTVDRARDVQEYSKDRWGLGSLVFKYNGDGISVISSTSYFARRINELEDDTEGSIEFLNTLGIDARRSTFITASEQKERRFTQELRMSLDDGVLLPGLSGIVGLYYQHAKRDTRVPGQFSQVLADAGIVPPYLGNQQLGVRSKDKALFGELYYDFVPNLTLTLGLRHYWIRQDTAPTVDSGIIITGGFANQPGLSNRQSGFVPKAVLSYKVGGGNIYASVAKGFRPGGSQQRLPDICSSGLAALGLTAEQVRQYRSDTLWSYEVGAKAQLADRRMTAAAAAFQIDWSSIQQLIPVSGCQISFTGNAGKARIRGGELEVSGRPFADVPLTVQAGIGYISAILTDPGYLPSPSGSRLPQVPRWTASISGYYEHPLDGDAKLFASADYSYTSTVNVSVGQGAFTQRQPLNIVNGNVGISFGRSQVLIYGKNLLNKVLNYGDQPSASFDRTEMGDFVSDRLPRVIVSRPRQFGIQYRRTF